MFIAAASTSQKFCGAAFSFLKDDPGLLCSAPGVANSRICAREVARNRNCNEFITNLFGGCRSTMRQRFQP